nr:hypothetical protein [uncultured Halomonas sp.]
MKRYFLPVILLLTSGCSFATPQPCWEENEIANVFGTYEVTEAQRFRGGLTAESTAKARIGETLTLTPSHFALWDDEFSSPDYTFECAPGKQAEGEVTPKSERHGNFYGFGMDRQVIKIISVHSSQENTHASHSFEHVEGELWGFFDGWFYPMEKIEASSKDIE